MLADSTVVVIGGGQAGLAVSHELGARSVEHVVLERGRVAQTWRDRWDSFRLVTPNWTMDLPGFPYAGDEPEGFDPRDEIVAYLERYVSNAGLPVREGVGVDRLSAGPGGFLLRTTEGEVSAESVVVCTGAYQRTHRPRVSGMFPAGLLVIDAEDYRRPSALPDGKVLVVGSGQTGCQLAEELHETGRDVFLACGRAAWAPRRPGGRDIVSWLSETTYFDMPLAALPSPAARLFANFQNTGRGGGHDLNFRTLQAAGVALLGRLSGVDEHRAYFADDLAESVAFGDARYSDVRRVLHDQLAAKSIPAPELPDPPEFVADAPQELSLNGFAAVIFTAGFRPDYARWVDFPAFDSYGFPLATDGASDVVPGLYFCGVHFLRKRKSSLLFGVGEDAQVVAQSIAGARTNNR